MKNIQKPTGTRDILPDTQKYWDFLSKIIKARVESFGFDKIDTPFFEYKNLFKSLLLLQ